MKLLDLTVMAFFILALSGCETHEEDANFIIDKEEVAEVAEVAETHEKLRERVGLLGEAIVKEHIEKYGSMKPYTIVEGDTLAGIAKRFLDSDDNYDAILKANKGAKLNPNLLIPGTTIILPPHPRCEYCHISPEGGNSVD